MSSGIFVIPTSGLCALCGIVHPRSKLIDIAPFGREPFELGPCCFTIAAVVFKLARGAANDVAPEHLAGVVQLELVLLAVVVCFVRVVIVELAREGRLDASLAEQVMILLGGAQD